MEKIKIGNNYKYVQDAMLSDKDISNSWNVKIKKESESEPGLRLPQFGALAAIQAHWSVCSEAATVVMPTGTGKTETMIMTIASERITKTIIVVPSNLLREQTVTKLCTFGVLKKIGVVTEESVEPTVALLKSAPKSEEEFDNLLNNCNVIVTTMSLVNRLNDIQNKKLVEFAELLIVDEAHHIMANSWLGFRELFLQKKVLQFTATPFRNDGKKVDGKIIYNYPLHKAQSEGYFQKINFYPIHEFNEKNGDFAIAKQAIECLENDIANKKEHIVLVRTTKIDRAVYLYENIYKKYYSKYNPVLIVSKILSAKEKKERMDMLKMLKSRIVVCVDMFGEGIDIPNLKIAAIHDKYQSLPITLQFVGRFARTSEGLGDASVITNIADETLKESLDELYSQDSDWNSLLANMSEKAIGKEMSLQELEKGFRGTGIDGISIAQLLPKVSMQAFKVQDEEPQWHNWKNVFKEDNCKYYLNDEKNVLVIIEPAITKIEWSTYKEISNLNWELHLIYFNKEKKVVFVNSSVKGIAGKIVENLFSDSERIKGECIFRCLYGINRLMLGTVGLNSAINGPVRYKMFAGIDIAQGISEAQKSTSTKSNLFGIGYNGNGKVSIGCSYKGTIWSRWVENIDFWMEWCNQTIEKVLDPSIDVEKLLEGVLIPKEITEIPQIKPYRIDWPIELDLCNDSCVYLDNQYHQIALMNSDIRLVDSEEDAIHFDVLTDEFHEEICLTIGNSGYCFEHRSGDRLNIHIRKKECSLVEFFQEYPPRIKFVDQSTLEGNYYVTLTEKEPLRFSDSDIMRWDWEEKGVNISVESQGLDKKKDSIQYCVINYLKGMGKYDVIFDDDNSGEIADIVTIKIEKEAIAFEFYHCKYSHGEKAGHRVSDLYEVCGQAEKSVEWKQDMINVIDRMIRRENQRINADKTSRFEVGDFEVLGEIRNRLKMFPATLKIYVVQPGVDGTSITDDMHQILMASKTYLQETYGIEMGLICS